MAIIALDVGMKHTGICIYLEGICMPRGTYDTEAVHSEMEKIESEYHIDTIVIGMPYSLDGRETEMCRWIRGFVNNNPMLSLKHIEYINEALTSAEAENIMREQYGVQLRKKEKDAVAACLILENYINEKEKKE